MCGVIVVDAGRCRSTWHGRDAYMHNNCLGYRHNFALFYQLHNSNFFTHRIICLHERSLKWNLRPPGLFFIILLSDLLFCNLLFSDLYTKKNQKYFDFYLSLSDLTFASDREGIDNPFIALGASICLFVYVQLLVTCVFLLLDWYLGS